MRIYIPLSEDGKYYILAELPAAKSFRKGEWFFETEEWTVLYERTRGTFKIEGVKLSKLGRAIRRALRRVRA